MSKINDTEEISEDKFSIKFEIIVPYKRKYKTVYYKSGSCF